MKPKFFENFEKIEIEESIGIPSLDGERIASRVPVKVWAYRNPKDGEIYFDDEALAEFDRVKARHMGILLPECIKELRVELGVTQDRMAELLRIGKKSFCRWELGRERPSQSINLLLAALYDGRIDVAYLESRATPNFDWRQKIKANEKASLDPSSQTPFQSDINRANKSEGFDESIAA